MNSGGAVGSVEAIAFTGPGRVQSISLAVQAPAAGHVLIRTAYIGLCGTDRDLYLGTHPYLAGGQSAYPLIPGHEWSGTVIAVGDDVLDLSEGDRVVGDPFVACGRCRYCRAQRRNLCARRSEIGVRGGYPGAAAGVFSVPERVCTRVPESLALEHAVLAEPAVTVLSGLHRTGAGQGDRLAVIGTGTLGLLAVAIARAAGARVHAIGIDEQGLDLARAQGAESASPPDEAEPDAFDVVVEAAGAADGLARAVRLSAPGGRVALLGMPSITAAAPDTTDLVAKDLEIHGILGGVEHYPTALGLIADKVVDASALIARVHQAGDAAQAYHSLAHHTRQRPKLLLGF